MNHIQLSIEATEPQQETLIAELSDLNAVGFEQTESHLIAYFNEEQFQSYEVLQIVKAFLFHQSIVAQKNWNEEWERDFKPVIVEDFCAVRAHFHSSITSVQYEILITPKMSFGTGHHATTYMMMQEMQNLDFKNKTVFDFGTGTGVLAILAEKLGAQSVIAIDNDEWSVENTLKNTENNNCTKIEVKQSSSIPDKVFDIILANINRNVILEYLPQLGKSVMPGGYILFSGLLTSDQEHIVEACNKVSLQLIKQAERSNWIALLFVNKI